MNTRFSVLVSRRAGLYSLLVLLAALSGFAYGARTTGLFACQSADSGSDKYIGLCNVTNYGDYDHGAFWFGLEDSAVDAAKQAAVLFIGNSRMQFALSTSALDGWFNSRALQYYLLGFSRPTRVIIHIFPHLSNKTSKNRHLVSDISPSTSPSVSKQGM